MHSLSQERKLRCEYFQLQKVASNPKELTQKQCNFPEALISLSALFSPRHGLQQSWFGSVSALPQFCGPLWLMPGPLPPSLAPSRAVAPRLLPQLVLLIDLEHLMENPQCPTPCLAKSPWWLCHRVSWLSFAACLLPTSLETWAKHHSKQIEGRISQSDYFGYQLLLRSPSQSVFEKCYILFPPVSETHTA